MKAQGGGIGTLIVFIAIILVAAIAAAVLITTSGTLQSRALLVGTESTKETSARLMVESVIGVDTLGSTKDGKIEILKIKVRPSAGSEPIDMERLVLSFRMGDKYASAITYGCYKSEKDNFGCADDDGYFSYLSLIHI